MLGPEIWGMFATAQNPACSHCFDKFLTHIIEYFTAFQPALLGWDITVNKTEKTSSFMELIFYEGER